jgi:hypothetical protein
MLMVTDEDWEWARKEDLYRARMDALSLPRILREEVLIEGRKQGLLVGRINLYQHMLKKPLTPSEALFTLSLEALQSLAEELKRELQAHVEG